MAGEKSYGKKHTKKTRTNGDTHLGKHTPSTTQPITSPEAYHADKRSSKQIRQPIGRHVCCHSAIYDIAPIHRLGAARSGHIRPGTDRSGLYLFIYLLIASDADVLFIYLILSHRPTIRRNRSTKKRHRLMDSRDPDGARLAATCRGRIANSGRISRG